MAYNFYCIFPLHSTIFLLARHVQTSSDIHFVMWACTELSQSRTHPPRTEANKFKELPVNGVPANPSSQQLLDEPVLPLIY